MQAMLFSFQFYKQNFTVCIAFHTYGTHLQRHLYTLCPFFSQSKMKGYLKKENQNRTERKFSICSHLLKKIKFNLSQR